MLESDAVGIREDGMGQDVFRSRWGGVRVLGLALGLVFGAASCGDEEDGYPEHFEGRWVGTWNTEVGFAGGFTLELDQKGRVATGSALFSDAPCFSSGTVEAQLGATPRDFTATLYFPSGATVALVGALGTDNVLRANFQVGTEESADLCAGLPGTIEGQRE